MTITMTNTVASLCNVLSIKWTEKYHYYHGYGKYVIAIYLSIQRAKLLESSGDVTIMTRLKIVA